MYYFSYQEGEIGPFASGLIIALLSILVVGVGTESYKLSILEPHTSENQPRAIFLSLILAFLGNWKYKTLKSHTFKTQEKTKRCI